LNRFLMIKDAKKLKSKKTILSKIAVHWANYFEKKEVNSVVKVERINQDVLELIAVCIDFPCRLINRFRWCGGRNIYKAVEKLVKEGYVKRYRKDGINSLRITKKGKFYLSKVNEKRFSANDEKRKYGKSERKKRMRIHRIAASFLMMQNAGVKIYVDEKPNIFSLERMGETILENPAFYSSYEIKDLGIECKKIKFTRAVGMLITKDNLGFIVYNTEDSLIKWSSDAEQRLYGVITSILLRSYIQIDDLYAIMIGSSMGSAKKQLLSKGGPQNSYFRLDGTYSQFYFIPEDKHGDLLLKFLSDTNRRKKMREAVLNNYRVDTGTLPFASDGVDDKGRVTLLAYEFDMEKIRKFKSGVELFEQPGKVICFEFQKKVLEEYFEGLVDIEVLDNTWLEGDINLNERQ